MKTNNVSPGKSKLGREIAVVIACKLLFIFGQITSGVLNDPI